MKIKLFEEFINESLGKTSYHFTNTWALMNMLNDGHINLTLSVGSKADHELNKKKFYFLSAQTTRNGGYGKRRNMPVMLVLDGEKLNNNFKSFPINYWNLPNLDDKHRQEADEFEERIVSDKQEISFKKYVKEIHVFLNANKEEKPQKDQKLQASHAKNKAAEMNIPIFFYDNSEAYFNNNKSKAIDIETVDEQPEPDGWSDREWDTYKILGIIVGADEKLHSEMADKIIAGGFHKNKESWNDKTIDQIRTYIIDGFKEFALKWQLKYKNSYLLRDLYNSVEATIHNARSTRNKFTKWAFGQFTKEMKSVGAGELKDFIEKKYGKL